MSDLLFHLVFVLPVTGYLLRNSGNGQVSKRQLIHALLFMISVTIFSGGWSLFSHPKNHFQTMGVLKTDSSLIIKQQFKRLSLIFHPDKNRSPTADTDFAAIRHAYEILSDSYLRERYDRFGEDDTRKRTTANEISNQFGKDAMNVAMFYVGWIVIIYLYTMQKAMKDARSWCYIALLIICWLECSLKLTTSDWDIFLSIFPRTTIFEKVNAIHSIYPAIFNMCCIISRALFVDWQDRSAAALEAVCHSNALILHIMRQQFDYMKEILTERDHDTNGNNDIADNNETGNEFRRRHTSVFDHFEHQLSEQKENTNETDTNMPSNVPNQRRQGWNPLPSWLTPILVIAAIQYFLR